MAWSVCHRGNGCPSTRSDPARSCCHKTRNMAEIVTVVGVGHQHVLSARGQYPAFQSVAVSLLLDVYYSGTFCLRDLDRAVGRTIVGNDYFARYARSLRAAIALRTHTPTVSRSFRQGMTTDNSIGCPAVASASNVESRTLLEEISWLRLIAKLPLVLQQGMSERPVKTDYQRRARGLHKIVTGPPPYVVQTPVLCPCRTLPTRARRALYHCEA